MSQHTVISIARLSAVNDRILLLRSQLKAAFCEHALRLEMSVYTTLTSLLKEFVKPWAEAQEEIISEKDINNICSDEINKLDESSHYTRTLSRLENTSSSLLEARLIVTNYLQDILAALLYLMPTNELVQVENDKHTDNINNNYNSTSARTDFTNDNTSQFDIRCYPVPPLMSANQSAFYVSNAQRRHCTEVFFYLCYSSLLPRHHVIAALYPLLDTFSTSSSNIAVSQTLSNEHANPQINDCNAKNDDKIKNVRSTGYMSQTSTLENSVTPNMLSDKRFVHTRQFVKYLLTGLLLSWGSGVRTLCRVFILDDRIEHGAIVEASQQVIRLLTNFNESYVWLAINNINSSSSNDSDVNNAQNDTKCCKVQMIRVTQEAFMKCICKELINLFTECAPNNDNSVKSTILSERTPSFLQNMHNSTLPAETLEERLHIFLALLANEMVELPRRDAVEVKSCANYPYAYKRFYYFNKYFLTPSFAILSLRINCSAKSQSATSSNDVNKEGINDGGNTENNNDVTESILLSLRRLYCLLHATECGVAAKALLLVLESIMPGLLMLSALINHKARFVPTSIKIELFERIWAKLLSTEFDAYAEQLAEIMINACFTSSLRYAFIADDCIHQRVELCVLPKRENDNTQHHTTEKLEKTEKDCKDKVNIFDENESNAVVSSCNNNNNDDDCVVWCLQALRQVVFVEIGSKNEETYSDGCEKADTENCYTEDMSVNDRTLRIASALMENKTSESCQNYNNSTKQNELDATDNNNNNMLAVSHVLQSAVLYKLATACTAYSVCNASHDYDINNLNNNTGMDNSKRFADSNVLVLQHQVESAIQLVELVCVEGEVNSIFGTTPSFAHTLHVLSIIYPLSSICMQWALSLVPKLLQMTTQEANSNNILAWELKETMKDQNSINITSAGSAAVKPNEFNITSSSALHSSSSSFSSISVKRASLLRELHILHETIERNTEQTVSVDCNDSNINAQRILALEAIERAITHLESLQHTRNETEMRLSKRQQEDNCNTNGENTLTNVAKKNINITKEDREKLAEPEELVTKSFVIEEWKPMVNALVWALDTHSNSTMAVSLMQLAHSLDTITLCNNVSEYVTPHVQSYVCAELWPVLIRALFVCNDICVVTNTVRCLCWLAMYRFDSPTSTHIAHTLFTCLQRSSSSSSSSSSRSSSSSSCLANSKKQSEEEVAPLMRFLLSEVHLSRASLGNKAHVTRFKLRLLELILSLCDYDGDHRTLMNVDDAITQKSQHQSSLYTMLAALCNAQEEAILQIAVLHLIGHVVVSLYPRVSLRLVCQLCYDVFHHCPVVMARASCAAMLHNIVLSLQEANLLSALQDDVDLNEVKVLAEAMSCYELNSSVTKTVQTTGTKIGKNSIIHSDSSNESMYNSLHTMQPKSPQTQEQIMHNENEESDNAQRQEHYEVIRNHGKAILHLLQNLLSHVLEVEESQRHENSTADQAFIVTKQKTNIRTSLSATSHLPQLVLSKSIMRNAKLY